MKAMFSYYGGKQRIASKIIPLLPPHTVYVEPFAGGAAVLFEKGLPNISNSCHYIEVLNDTNELITNFYRVMQDRKLASQLIQRLNVTPYSKNEYRLAYEILKNWNKSDNVELDAAWAFYVAIQMSFSNKLQGGWGRSVVKNNPTTWGNYIIQLKAMITRLRHAYIENVDALQCIKNWDAPQTLFYCDPPYVGSDMGHYKGYSQEEFENLCQALDKCHGSFILSCYENPCIPKHWERFEIDALQTAAGSGVSGKDRDTRKKKSYDPNRRRKELIFRADRSCNARSDLQHLLHPRGQQLSVFKTA